MCSPSHVPISFSKCQKLAALFFQILKIVKNYNWENIYIKTNLGKRTQ